MTINKKILIIDDEPNIRDSLADFLEDFGIVAKTAATAEAGMKLLEKETFSVAIVDLRLPGISGESFIIKVGRLYPGMRFLIHTGSIVYSLSGELEALGVRVEDIFVKPVTDMHSFVSAINRLTEE